METTNAEALTLISNAQLLMGKLDEAIASAQKVHTLPHKQYGVVHYVCARAFEGKNLPAEAAAEYETFLKEASQDQRAKQARAALLALKEKTQRQ